MSIAAPVEFQDDSSPARAMVEAKYSQGKESLSLADLANVSSLEEIKRKKTTFLRGSDTPEENKQLYTSMIVEHIAPFAKIQENCWREIGRTILFVKTEEIHKACSPYESLKDWLKEVVIPELAELGITNCGEKALQQWANYVEIEEEILLRCNPIGKSNLTELDPDRSRLRKLVSLTSSPGKVFAGIELTDNFVEDNKEELLDCVAEAFNLNTYEPNDEDPSLDKKARASTLNRIQEEAKHYIGEFLAKKLINSKNIKVGTYYKILTAIEWMEPDDDKEGVWNKRTIKGLEENWVKIISYDEEDQTVRVRPWNVFKMDKEERLKNQMDADGVILHDIPIAHFDFKGDFGLSESEVEDQAIPASVVLTELDDTYLTGSEYKRLFKIARAKGCTVDELIIDFALQAIKGVKEEG